MREPIIEVVFRKDRDGEVFALFPYVQAHGYYCTSYQHIGQHGAADYTGCIARSRPAIPAEYADLKAELKRIGYNLRVIKRRNRNREMTP